MFLDLIVVSEVVFRDEKSSAGELKETLVKRASCLLSEDDSGMADLATQIRAAYKLRSMLVHGDESPSLSQLVETSAELYAWGSSFTSRSIGA